MITNQNCLDWILKKFPGFQRRWQSYLDYWEGEKAGLCNDIAEFSRYAEDLIKQCRIEELKSIFDAVEQLMTDGDKAVKDAIATCFLENLINQVSAGEILASDFIHLLGPKSITFCRAWDKFTGVQTEG